MSSTSILLVEDNPLTRRMMKVALDVEGYQVTEAPNASVALESARIQLPDLVLQDLLLPDMNGVELAHRLRALPGGADMLILALSALTDDGEIVGTGEFDALLPKPMEPSQVLEAIEAHLTSRGLSSPGQPIDRKVRVLVVEDDPVVRGWLQIELTQIGLDVAIATSGGEALTLAVKHAPHLVLSDVHIWQLNGFALCQRLRRQNRLPRVRIVLMNAHGFDASEGELARELGADAFAPKSAELIELVNALVVTLRLFSTIPPPLPGNQTDRYTELLRRLDGQASLRADIASNGSILDMVNDLLRRVREMCTRPLDIEQTLGELLASYLDACGFGLGAVLLQHGQGELTLGPRFGDHGWIDRLDHALLGHDSWLRQLLDEGTPVGWTARMAEAMPIAEIAAAADIGCLLLLPLSLGDDSRGLMILGSRVPHLPMNWEDLARALQGPLAETLALGQAVAKLAVSEERFRGIAEATGDGIVATDRLGRIFFTNPAAQRMFSSGGADLHGVFLRHLCPLLETPRGTRQVFGLRANGRQFPLELHTRTCEDRFAGAHQIHVLRDLTEQQTCEALSRIANRDPLTDLWNRRRFDEELMQRLSEARRYEGSGALLLIDLDGFKNLNDSRGHAAGDAVLKKFALLLVRLTRNSDLVARLGGDEFALLLPKVEDQGARRCAERILIELRLGDLPVGGKDGQPVTCSIGMALFPAHSMDPETLFEYADQALYQSKREGRERATMYEPPATVATVSSSGICLQQMDCATSIPANLQRLAEE